jgi:lipopolysaccharide export LptBFGC system permease protein LptF
MRTQIRGGVSRATVGFDRQWLASASTDRLYSYEYEESGALKNLVVYDFNVGGVHLGRIVSGQSAQWSGANSWVELRGVVSIGLQDKERGWSKQDRMNLELTEEQGVFKPAVDKPSYLSAQSLSDYIISARKRGAVATIQEVALQKKYAGPFGVLVMALIGMPLALSFGRQSTIIALCLAIALGLIFWAATGGFQQMGDYGLLPPIVAAWSPILIFAASGIYILFRTKT